MNLVTGTVRMKSTLQLQTSLEFVETESSKRERSVTTETGAMGTVAMTSASWSVAMSARAVIATQSAEI